MKAVGENTSRILAWLTNHPDSTVGDIATATGLGSQFISGRLRGAVMAGRARRDREHGAAPWRWSALAARKAAR
jgi:hypothetical protein